METSVAFGRAEYWYKGNLVYFEEDPEETKRLNATADVVVARLRSVGCSDARQIKLLVHRVFKRASSAY